MNNVACISSLLGGLIRFNRQKIKVLINYSWCIMRVLGTGENVSRKPSYNILFFYYDSMLRLLFSLHSTLCYYSQFSVLLVCSLKSCVSTTSCLVQSQITFRLNHWSSFPFFESWMWYEKRCIHPSLGAHSACQLSTIDIWKARE